MTCHKMTLVVNMNDWMRVAKYNAWLLDMNIKGYGSCNHIDRLVSKGELICGKDYEVINDTNKALTTTENTV